MNQRDQPDRPPSTGTTTDATSGIDDLGEFLVHALELEHESAARYAQLADSMEVHHNHTVAALFRRLAAMSAEHAERIAEGGRGVRLPRIAPWAFKWNCPDAPEVCNSLDAEISYRMTPLQALRLALHNESRGKAFYAHIATSSRDANVRRLAAETVAEETKHVALLQTLLNEQQRHNVETPEDLDPPHVPA